MNLTAFKVTTGDGLVDVLGKGLSEHFAWTQKAKGDDYNPTAKPEHITHLPTGLLIASASKLAEAKRIVAALEALALPGNGWNDSDADRVYNASIQAMAPLTPADWLERAAANEDKPKAKISAVDRILASREWRGSVVTLAEHEVIERTGDCAYLGCPGRHARLAFFHRGSTRVERRHYETVPCHRIEHPSGAVAHVRADAT